MQGKDMPKRGVRKGEVASLELATKNLIVFTFNVKHCCRLVCSTIT